MRRRSTSWPLPRIIHGVSMIYRQDLASHRSTHTGCNCHIPSMDLHACVCNAKGSFLPGRRGFRTRGIYICFFPPRWSYSWNRNYWSYCQNLGCEDTGWYCNLFKNMHQMVMNFWSWNAFANEHLFVCRQMLQSLRGMLDQSLLCPSLKMVTSWRYACFHKTMCTMLDVSGILISSPSPYRLPLLMVSSSGICGNWEILGLSRHMIRTHQQIPVRNFLCHFRAQYSTVNFRAWMSKFWIVHMS